MLKKISRGFVAGIGRRAGSDRGVGLDRGVVWVCWSGVVIAMFMSSSADAVVDVFPRRRDMLSPLPRHHPYFSSPPPNTKPTLPIDASPPHTA